MVSPFLTARCTVHPGVSSVIHAPHDVKTMSTTTAPHSSTVPTDMVERECIMVLVLTLLVVRDVAVRPAVLRCYGSDAFIRDKPLSIGQPTNGSKKPMSGSFYPTSGK